MVPISLSGPCQPPNLPSLYSQVFVTHFKVHTSILDLTWTLNSLQLTSYSHYSQLLLGSLCCFSSPGPAVPASSHRQPWSCPVCWPCHVQSTSFSLSLSLLWRLPDAFGYFPPLIHNKNHPCNHKKGVIMLSVTHLVQNTQEGHKQTPFRGAQPA